MRSASSTLNYLNDVLNLFGSPYDFYGFMGFDYYQKPKGFKLLDHGRLIKIQPMPIPRKEPFKRLNRKMLLR